MQVYILSPSLNQHISPNQRRRYTTTANDEDESSSEIAENDVETEVVSSIYSKLKQVRVLFCCILDEMATVLGCLCAEEEKRRKTVGIRRKAVRSTSIQRD